MHKSRHRRVPHAIAACTLVIALIAGCPPQSILPPIEDTGQSALQRFTSEQEFLDYFKNQAIQRNVSTTRSTPFFFPFLAMAPPADVAANDAGGAMQAESNDDEQAFSTTNIQEAGVDESDVLKSDGTYFYIARNSTIHIVQADPMAELAEAGRITLDDKIDSMYLVGTTLITIGQKYATFADAAGVPEPDTAVMWPPYHRESSVVVTQIDIADRASPSVSGEVTLDGSLVSSRITGGRLILVLTILPPLPTSPSRDQILAMSADDILPKMRLDDAVSTAVSWQDFYRPGTPDGYVTTSVITLDTSDVEQVIGSTAVMADAGTIYASTEAIYITDDEYDADNSYRQKTVIHKLALPDQGAAEYVASGEVPGRLLNQFSLSEYEGDLRVATQTNNGWGPIGIAMAETSGAATRIQQNNPGNGIYVLRETNGGLPIIGQVTGLAPGEDIYAARFVGTRGFLVTFERIDPLFVVDLSNPADPQLKGELKIPGWSDYLHPFGENLLIGVGRSAPAGFPVAVQFSLFDVSDLENPTVIEQLELGGYGSMSAVSVDHKAFTFMSQSGTLAIPVKLTDEDGNWSTTFDGIVCYTVGESGFDEVGQLACVSPGGSEWDWGYWYSWRRAALIDNTLYAVSDAGVRAASLDDLATTEVVELGQ